MLANGQSQTWLLGNKVVTITTSGGGGNKSNNAGLCDKCLALYQNNGEPPEPKPTPPSTSTRRRHKSAFVTRSASAIESKASTDDIGIQPRMSFDDMMSSPGSTPEHEVGVQTGSSLSDPTPTKLGLETEAMEAFLIGKDFIPCPKSSKHFELNIKMIIPKSIMKHNLYRQVNPSNLIPLNH